MVIKKIVCIGIWLLMIGVGILVYGTFTNNKLLAGITGALLISPSSIALVCLLFWITWQCFGGEK